MTEEQVFLAALDLDDVAARAAYLDQACGGDVVFRRQVEDLLAVHFREGEFLDVPVGVQMASAVETPSNDDTRSHRSTREESPRADRQKPEEEPDDLHFLQPST